jgi:hypothetical protein
MLPSARVWRDRLGSDSNGKQSLRASPGPGGTIAPGERRVVLPLHRDDNEDDRAIRKVIRPCFYAHDGSFFLLSPSTSPRQCVAQPN